jgi:hypothetical protein
VVLVVAGVLISTAAKTEAHGGIANDGGVVGASHVAQQRPDYVWRESQASLLDVVVDGMPLEKLAGRGKLYVEAVRGAEYELRVRNPFPVRVAVALSVDGMNTIDARRTTRWDSSKWVIEPYQTITISGWQMSSERARRFYFTNERDSYGAKLGRTSDLGVISVAFFRERTRVRPMTRTRPYPPDEMHREEGNVRRQSDESEAPSSAGSASTQARNRAATPPPSAAPDDDYAATGIGRSVHHDVRWTYLDLDPRPAAEVTIRYEYRDALVRLGLLPRYPRPAPDPLGRRERSRGFEDPRYSPEP